MLHDTSEAASDQAERAGITRSYDDLPGPRGWPIVGSAFNVPTRTAHLSFERWAARYGPSFRVRMGPRRLLVTHDPAVVNEVLRERPRKFMRPTRAGNLLVEMGFDQGLFFANDEAWQVQRRMVMSAFNPEHVRNFFPRLLRVAKRLQAKWEVCARNGVEVDLRGELMRYTVDAIAGLAFGSDVNTIESGEDAIQRHLNRIFPALARRSVGIVPYWRYVKFRRDRELDESAVAVQAAIDMFISAARGEMRADPTLVTRPRNLLHSMLAAAADHSSLTDRDVAGNVLIMLLAGEDTTANTLTWMIWFLFRNPTALLRARDEVRSIAPTLDRVTVSSLDDLHFVNACLQETMRLKPVAPMLAMQAARDVSVCGIEIPKDTIVIALTRMNAMDETHIAEAAMFKPERWMDAAGHPVPAKASIPFGSGPRLCPGRYLATLEMKLAIAMLLGRFEIAGVAADSGGEPAEVFAFAMGPAPTTMKIAMASLGPGV